MWGQELAYNREEEMVVKHALNAMKTHVLKIWSPGPGLAQQTNATEANAHVHENWRTIEPAL